MKYLNSSLFRKYLMSYFIVVILCCSIISLILINFYLVDLKNHQKHSIQEKIQLSLDDIEDQFTSLQKIALNVSIQKIYRPGYFKSNKYYEIELLKDFEQYRNHSSICSEYFLVYIDSNIVFHSSGSTMLADKYMESLGMQDQNNILDKINNSVALDVHTFPMLDFSFLVFPVRNVNDMEAAICFVLYHSDLRSRVQTTTGGLPGSYSVYHNNNLLFNNVYSGYNEQKQNIIEAEIDSDPAWSMVLYYTDEILKLSPYQILAIIMLLSAFLLLLGLATYAAYRNYKPIKGITSRYGNQVTNEDKSYTRNELLEIDSLFQSFLENASSGTAKLAEQKKIFRQQLLYLMVNGDFTEEMEQYLISADLSLPGPYYCVFVMDLKQKGTQMGLANISRDNNEILGLIEDLSDDEIILHAIGNEIRIVILASLADKWYKDDATDIIKELFEAKGYSFDFAAGNVYDMIIRYSVSYLEALSNLNSIHSSVMSNNGEWSQKIHDGDSFNYDVGKIASMISAVRSGDEEAAYVAFDQFLTDLIKVKPSNLIQRYIFYDVTRELLNTSKQIGSPLSEKQISLIITASNISDFHDAVTQIIHHLTYVVRAKEEREQQDIAAGVISYIQQNYTDYNLTLEKISDDLNIGANYISQYIKQETKKSYKDYIIGLRINYAKELLMNSEFTVADICTKVGYSNISHFIKTFKNYIGITPGVYRKEN